MRRRFERQLDYEMWQSHRRQAEPDCAAVHRELKRKHVALSILWEEYITGEPGRVSYSRYASSTAPSPCLTWASR